MRPPDHRERLERALLLALAAGVGAWGLGQVVGDRTVLAALLFYVPAPLVALGVVPAAALAIRRRDRASLAVLALTALPLGSVLLVENRWTGPPGADATASTAAAGPDALRLLHWNIGSAGRGVEGIETEIRRHEPDLIVLSELPHPGEGGVHALRGALEPWRLSRKGRLGVLHRGERPRTRSLLDDEHLQVVEAHLGGGDWTLLVIDVVSDPAIARGPLLREVRALMRGREPDLVVGDFNTPRRSVHLRGLPRGWAHAYDEAGAGWGYTYSTPVPLWAIDLLLVGPGVEVLDYAIDDTLASDHAIQLASLTRRDDGGAGPR